MTDTRSDVETRVKCRFKEEISEHNVTVLRDSGLYRHLRCRKPGTVMYGFDIVTWPGYLVICGAMGDYMFQRIPDMFEFFGSRDGDINPHYWAQKLQGPGRDKAMVYSREAYEARVLDWLTETKESLEPAQQERLAAGVHNQLLSMPPLNRHEAMDRLMNFECDGLRLVDLHERSLDEYDSLFLWCCHGIVWAIQEYRKKGES